MSNCPDSAATTFDPFGEPMAETRAPTAPAGDRRARNAAVAVFWGLALLLIAGRAYLGDKPVAEMVANAQSGVAMVLASLGR